MVNYTYYILLKLIKGVKYYSFPFKIPDSIDQLVYRRIVLVYTRDSICRSTIFFPFGHGTQIGTYAQYLLQQINKLKW